MRKSREQRGNEVELRDLSSPLLGKSKMALEAYRTRYSTTVCPALLCWAESRRNDPRPARNFVEIVAQAMRWGLASITLGGRRLQPSQGHRSRKPYEASQIPRRYAI